MASNRRRGNHAMCSTCKQGIAVDDVVMLQGMYHSSCAPEFRTADDYRREREEQEREERERERVAAAKHGEQIALDVQ